MWITPLLLVILFELFADIASKQWSMNGGWMLWSTALGLYVLDNIFWLSALKNGAGLGRGAMIFSISSAILALIIGLLFFKESITRIQTFGMALGLCALFFLTWENM